MTTYPGPWIQAPDYTVEGYEAAVSASPYGGTIPYETHVQKPDEPPTALFVPWDATDIGPLILSTSSGTLGVASGTVDDGHVKASISYFISGISDHDRSADAWRSWRVSAFSPESLGARYWAPTPFVGITPPPDAIGWEWQDPEWAPGDSAKSEVLALVATWEADTNDSIDAVNGPVPDSRPFASVIQQSRGEFVSDSAPVPTAEADWLTDWAGPTTGPILETVPGPISGPHDTGLLNLTPLLDPQGRVVLTSTVTFEGFVPVLPTLALDGPLSPTDSVTYGHNITYTPTWTFRPPIFRWLYATPQITSAPPLRHTQRDDRHGPSPRNKPARTRQAGHRNTGYL